MTTGEEMIQVRVRKERRGGWGGKDESKDCTLPGRECSGMYGTKAYAGRRNPRICDVKMKDDMMPFIQ